MKLTNALIIILFIACIYSCHQSTKNLDGSIPDAAKQQSEINSMLDSFNAAAANADYKTYFNFFTDSAIFTGTDATERWDKKEFMVWAKPYFDKKNTWHFTALQRHIYIGPTGTYAWFDELLNTQMKICRGSGVLVKQRDDWKIVQYILSTTIPNELLDSVTKIKAPIEDKIIKGPTNK
ncbi:MAG TPA: nuclear transport factor 2 family protein [Hanamia sp.]|nr:nuclear transport factor 2 family protein [Hanamia sp.]